MVKFCAHVIRKDFVHVKTERQKVLKWTRLPSDQSNWRVRRSLSTVLNTSSPQTVSCSAEFTVGSHFCFHFVYSTKLSLVDVSYHIYWCATTKGYHNNSQNFWKVLNLYLCRSDLMILFWGSYPFWILATCWILGIVILLTTALW